MKRIVLCADDYGQALNISQAILELIQAERLSATSCLVTSPCWKEHSKWLIPYKNQIDIGLHFNLTEGEPLTSDYKSLYGQTFFPLMQMLRKSFTRALDQAVIERECEAQVKEFEAATGFLPAYIDGHQHVHQFPIVRQALVNVYNKYLRHTNAYIRLVNEELNFRAIIADPKKLVIYLSGTKPFKELLEKEAIPFNTTFAGIYSFSRAENFTQRFPRFLRQIKDRGLIMCHPGLPSENPADEIGHARPEEFAYLMSGTFLLDCEKEHVKIIRFSE